MGLGANVDSGTTKTFVRGGGPLVAGGVARNASKYLGLRADAIFADLPLRQSTLTLAQAGSASSYLFALNVGPVINIPVTKDWGGYILFGGGYYHRWGTLSSNTTVPGSFCTPFFIWWTGCAAASIPVSGSFTTSDQNHFGYDVGAGITRKMPSGVELYAEFRSDARVGERHDNGCSADYAWRALVTSAELRKRVLFRIGAVTPEFAGTLLQLHE